MRAFLVFFSALQLLAFSVLLNEPLLAQTGGSAIETVPNPFQGSSPVGEMPAAKSVTSKTKVSKAANAQPAESDADAKKRCGADPVVWANKKSKVYHFAGSTHYGRTKNGVYMCEKESVAAGMRPAKNEQHS